MINDIDKMVVVAEDGNATVRTGKAHIELKNYSKDRFDTKSIRDFVRYVNAFNFDTPVFVGDKCIEFYDDRIDYYTVPLARAYLETTKFIDIFFNLINQDVISIDVVEKTLHSLLDYGDMNVIELYNFTRNCNISAISDFERQIDTSGNYSILIKRQGKGDKTIKPVESIAFTVPVLKWHDDTHCFPFKVAMDYRIDNGFKVFFSFSNYRLQEMVDEAKHAIINSCLEALNNNIPVYYGKKRIEQCTDEWKYRVL